MNIITSNVQVQLTQEEKDKLQDAPRGHFSPV